MVLEGTDNPTQGAGQALADSGLDVQEPKGQGGGAEPSGGELKPADVSKGEAPAKVGEADLEQEIKQRVEAEVRRRLDAEIGRARTKWERKERAELEKKIRQELEQKYASLLDDEEKESKSEKEADTDDQLQKLSMRQQKLAGQVAVLKGELERAEAERARYQEYLEALLEEELAALPEDLRAVVESEEIGLLGKVKLARSLRQKFLQAQGEEGKKSFGKSTVRTPPEPEPFNPAEIGRRKAQERLERYQKAATEGRPGWR